MPDLIRHPFSPTKAAMVQGQRKIAIIAGFVTGSVLLAALALLETRRFERIGDGTVFNSTILMLALAAVALAVVVSAFQERDGRNCSSRVGFSLSLP